MHTTQVHILSQPSVLEIHGTHWAFQFKAGLGAPPFSAVFILFCLLRLGCPPSVPRADRACTGAEAAKAAAGVGLATVAAGLMAAEAAKAAAGLSGFLAAGHAHMVTGTSAGRSAAAIAAGGRELACGVLRLAGALGAAMGATEWLTAGMAEDASGAPPPRAARTWHDGPT